jgi:hypothetical protein
MVCFAAANRDHRMPSDRILNVAHNGRLIILTNGASMNQSVFVESEFWLLVVFSVVMPVAIIWMCLTVRKVSRRHVLAVGLLLVAIAGIDIYLLQALKRRARETPSTADDVIFDSEITVGLYVLPALLAGIGVNIASQVIIQHLSDAQRRFDAHGRSN